MRSRRPNRISLVVTDRDGKVVGGLGEAYVARRYAAAVDRAAKGVLGGG